MLNGTCDSHIEAKFFFFHALLMDTEKLFAYKAMFRSFLSL